MKSLEQKADVVFVVAFMAALLLPGLWMLARPPLMKSQAVTGEQYRALADLLEPAETLEEESHVVADWFRTRFPFRDRLIEANAMLRVRLFGASTSNLVVVGDDGWLFYTGEQDLESYRRVRPFSSADLVRWGHTVDRWVETCASVNARLVVVIAPDKASVYGDLLPAWTHPLGVASRLEQLESVLGARTDVVVIDARDVLREARSRGRPLFYKTDTHWNELAGYLVVQQISARLGNGSSAQLPEATVEVSTLSNGGDLARFLGLKRRLGDVDTKLSIPVATPPVIETVWGASSLPWKRREDLNRDMHIEPRVRSHSPAAPIGKVYVIRDSFGNAMIPYLALLFRDATYRWTEKLDPQELRQEHPDVVIVEIAERYLMKDPEDFVTKPAE